MLSHCSQELLNNHTDINTSIFISEESARCMLCQDAPCTKAWGSGQPDRFIRSLRFDNMSQSLKWIEDCSADDLSAAESACIHYDSPIRIKALAEAVRNSGTVSSSHHQLSVQITRWLQYVSLQRCNSLKIMVSITLPPHEENFVMIQYMIFC